MERIINLARRPSAVFALCAAVVAAMPAANFKTLFTLPNADGRYPAGALVQATNGDLYGTAEVGGSGQGGGANCQATCGTVFKITPGGKLTPLYSFCTQPNCTDGAYPVAGLAQATNGDLYGTTEMGGANDDGTVFKITLGGKLTPVYSFCTQPNCTDGAGPSGALIQAADGSLYGTTEYGGANVNGYCGSPGGCGTIFKITSSGTLTTVYSFCAQSGCADGAVPMAALVQGTDGDFYGTTSGGGAYGEGTVFKMTAHGALTTLHSFCAGGIPCTDGADPTAGLIQATDGNFYGTTYAGGPGVCVINGSTCGTVFRISATGALTTLYNFCSENGCVDGSYPYAGLVQATDGNLYGATYSGGKDAVGTTGGTLFKITTAGALTTLHSFCTQRGCPSAGPVAGLVQDTNGALYGTTANSGYATVFRLSVGLGTFVETLPTSGKVGTTVRILGTNLVGATSVKFNGTPAKYTVASASEIIATVPNGATTGKVEAVISSGTLSSNVPFRVLP